jgi:hypothetical protein
MKKSAREIAIVFPVISCLFFVFLAACNRTTPPEVSREPKAESRPLVPSASLKEAPLVKFPATVDCNSPAHWDGETLYLFNSAPVPWRSFGRNVFELANAAVARYNNKANGGRWIEATYKDDDGTLYGWYHNEPHPVCPKKESLTAPRIGAVLSRDNGANWQDLGFVLEAPADSLFCETQNHYFAGGNGDFCVVLDAQKQHFYLFISTYHRNVSEQGVAVARVAYADRRSPAGKAWKWYQGKWSQPGIGGHVTPTFPVATDWNHQGADAFWGASVHWNTHLNQYVMLLNRAIDKDWKQEGVYLSFNAQLENPIGWSKPTKILDREKIVSVPEMGHGWYPQVIGADTGGRETDKLAGRVARLFVHGKSVWEIVFAKPSEGVN